jgi:hypothetical protein
VNSSTYLRRAGQWFLHSGIQEECGGVARYYLIEQGRNARLSTEITGYSVSALCYLYRETHEDAYLDAARKAGAFLTRLAWDPRLPVFPFEYPPTTAPDENRAFFFDCGIIVRGLITLWRTTGEPEYLEAARNCGTGMARVFEQNGNYAPILQLPGCEPAPYGGSWSSNPGCYQLKSALGWLELYHETGEPAFQQYFETALGRALGNDAAFLPGTSELPRIMDRLHAYSYFLEALLAVVDRPACAAALNNGIRKAAGYLREIAPQFARSDVYAQILRVRLFADQLGAVPLDRAQAAEEASAVSQFQWESPMARLNGGFCFGRRGGQLTPYANPVSTAFCMQALNLWQKSQSGPFEETWRDLI